MSLPVIAGSGKSPYLRLNAFAKVMSYIEQSYVDPPDQSALIEAAIKGMVSSLDEHSAYYTPEEYAENKAEARGDFVGVGIEVDRRDDLLVIVEPIQGAAADKAGVKAGDVIRSVDGASVDGWSTRETLRKLKGKEGTVVRLEVERSVWEGGSVVHVFDLERTPIHLDAVSWKPLEKGFGYIRIRSFQPGTSIDVETALEELEAEAGPLKGIALDLRGNPGGLLVEGVQVSDLFVDKGTLLTTKGRSARQTEVFEAQASSTLFRGALVVVVDGRSASASEIVAGAIKDLDRGAILGTQTFGKGSVQSVVDLKGGAGLKLTTARYYTPGNHSIHGRGIAPDLLVEENRTLPEPEEAPEGERGPPKPWFSEDRQISAALDYLTLFVRVSGHNKDNP